MQEINFDWIRGDDEAETLVFTDEQNQPLDFTGSRFDCDIRPAGGEPIRLSTVSGEILVVNNEITLIDEKKIRLEITTKEGFELSKEVENPNWAEVHKQ